VGGTGRRVLVAVGGTGVSVGGACVGVSDGTGVLVLVGVGVLVGGRVSVGVAVNVGRGVRVGRRVAVGSGKSAGNAGTAQARLNNRAAHSAAQIRTVLFNAKTSVLCQGVSSGHSLEL